MDESRRYPRFDAAADRGHAHMVVHTVALAQTHGTGQRRRRMPKQNYAHALEAEYADKIVKLLERARSHYARLFAELPRLLARAEASRVDGVDAERADANEMEFARSLIDEAAKNMRRDLTGGELEKLVSYFARATSQAQRRELARQLTAALGVEVLPDEAHIPQLLEYFTHENATLIGSIPEEFHQEVAKLTSRAFTKRMNPDTYASLLQDRFDVAESRARFIARDQLGKLWGQLNAVRQRSVGIEQFTWMTRGDDKVRPKHARVHGKVFRYEDPPEVGRKGEKCLPGEDYGCRCDAVPVVDGILAAAKKLRGHARPVR